LLTAEQRNLRDAGVKSISPETRFDAAYKGIMQTALVLQYVAMTRATHELVMTSSRWSRFSERLRGVVLVGGLRLQIVTSSLEPARGAQRPDVDREWPVSIHVGAHVYSRL